MTDVHLVLVFILFGFSDKVLDATEVEAGNQYSSDPHGDGELTSLPLRFGFDVDSKVVFL